MGQENATDDQITIRARSHFKIPFNNPQATAMVEVSALLLRAGLN